MDVFKTLILDTPTVEGATGTVTSVDLTAGTGISVSGGPITSSGSINVTNTAPDQTVALTGGTGISTSGTYPNFTITNDAPDQTVSIASGSGISATGTYPNFTVSNTEPDQTVVLTAGTGISTSGTYPNFTVTNSAPDQTVSIAAGTGINVTGTYPNFTVTNSSPSSGGDVVGPASSTDNGIVRFDGTTGKLVQDSSSVVIDDSGNVGIGTTSPQVRLQTSTSLDGAQAIFNGAQSTNEQTLLFRNSYYTNNTTAGVAAIGWIDSGLSGGNLVFKTGANGGGTTNIPAERVRIDQAGNVGIGTTTPSSTLEAVGDITASGTGNKTLKVATTSNAYSYLTMNAWALDRAQLRAETYSGGGSGSGGGILSMWTGNTSGTMTERMRIDGVGNVGIGTTSPATKLDVLGTMQAGNGTYGLQAGTGWGGTATDTYLATNGASTQIVFAINGSEKMRINSSGEVGINKTPNTSAKLDVLGGGSGAYYGTQTYGPVYYAKEDNTDNVGRGIFNFIRGSTLVGQIVTTNTTCAYNNVSDYRLKEITGPVVDSGKFIDGLKPKVGTWKSTGEKFVGFVAHEFAEVSPSSVTGEKDAVDADGNPVYQSMQASTPEVMANLIAELQSLRARVAELEAKA